MKYLSKRKGSPDLISNLTENFERLLSAFDQNNYLEFPEMSTSNWMPKIDIKEMEDKYVVYADVPGIKVSDIQVSVDNGTLLIKGERESEQKEEKENYLRIERSSGSFMRRLTLPEAVDTNAIKAKGKDGVLEVIIPKSNKSNARQIKVEQ